MKRLGIDEKSFLRRHQYVSVLVDLDEGHALDVAQDRKAESLVPWFEGLSPQQWEGIEPVAMDMWEPYRKTVRAPVPDADAKIVYDKFHVTMHLNRVVDAVRRQEHRALRAARDTRLTGTKYQWLKRLTSLSAAARVPYAPRPHLQTARAWPLKQSLARF